MIEFIYNDSTSVYFTPLENGKCEYMVEVHRFDMLDCYKEVLTRSELDIVIKNPNWIFEGAIHE